MLEVTVDFPLTVQNGGLFISRGVGAHPARTLSSWELILVESGTLAIREGDEDFWVSAGEILLLKPGCHHVGLETFPLNLKFYWLHFDVNLLDINETAIKHGCNSSTATLLSIPQHCKVHDPQYIISLFRQFLSEQENRKQSSALALILLLMLQQISAGLPDDANITHSGVALAYKARQLIKTQYHLPMSTASLAEQLFCNPDYLGRVFRKTFGMTLTEAIHRQRVSSAEKLLLNDMCSLTEVAERSGFHDVGYFRQIFRKQIGLTPVAYKRRYCKEHINSD
ncbi:helix-turn-helix domain-containing protein [Obesumbacterium proteus]|uniref:helix-turn-helix domain-containing protein n=1 Tax=Obesumbacterium proteus TaxID=82983 RepID=UPI00242D71DE|nr:AraC family transcriptional regulator [Obesumbacterium proteus]